jgi:trimethylamine corrinoid protein
MSEEVLSELKSAIISGDPDAAKLLSEKSLSMHLDSMKIFNTLVSGMQEVGKKYENKEYFLVDLSMAGMAFRESIDLILPVLKEGKNDAVGGGRVVIGSPTGDVHDLGKNLVVAMLIAAGYDVYDIGVDQPPEAFVNKAKEVKAEVVGSSAYLPTTRAEQKKIEEALKNAGIRSKLKTIVGGYGTSQKWANEIGADAWANDAWEAVRVVGTLVKDLRGKSK